LISTYRDFIKCDLPSGVTTGGKGCTIPRAPDHYGGAESLRRVKCFLGAPKSHNNFTITFFNTVNFFLKDLRFEHGSAKLVSCPGRSLNSLRPWTPLDLPHLGLRKSLDCRQRKTSFGHSDCGQWCNQRLEPGG